MESHHQHQALAASQRDVLMLWHVCAGYDDQGAQELMRLYQTIHTDHEVSYCRVDLHLFPGCMLSHVAHCQNKTLPCTE